MSDATATFLRAELQQQLAHVLGNALPAILTVQGTPTPAPATPQTRGRTFGPYARQWIDSRQVVTDADY